MSSCVPLGGVASDGRRLYTCRNFAFPHTGFQDGVSSVQCPCRCKRQHLRGTEYMLREAVALDAALLCPSQDFQPGSQPVLCQTKRASSSSVPVCPPGNSGLYLSNGTLHRPTVHSSGASRALPLQLSLSMKSQLICEGGYQGINLMFTYGANEMARCAAPLC